MSFISRNKEFYNACMTGNLKLAQQLYNVTVLINTVEIERIFRIVCSNGHLELAKWLYTIYPKMDISYLNDYIFRHACSDGLLDVAQWIYEINPSCNLQACGNHAMRLACTHGHLPVMKWIFSKVPEMDVSMNSDELLHSACIGGYQEIIEWILSHRKQDLSKRPFLLLCEHGYLSSAQWLYDKYHFPFYHLEAFTLSCRKGHYDLVKWLLTKLTLHEELFEPIRVLFHGACRDGHQSILELFVTQLPSTILLTEHLLQGFYYSCTYNHLPCAQWFLTQQPIPTFEDTPFLLNICKECCFLNYTEMLTWLFETFHSYIYPYFPYQEIIDNLSYMSDQHVDSMQLIYLWYPSIQFTHEMFQHACWSGSDEIAKFIIDHTLDVTMNQHQLFHTCRLRGRWRVAKYMSDKYPNHYEVILDHSPVVSYIILTEIKNTPRKTYSDDLSFDTHTCVICYGTCQLFTNCNHPYCETCLQKNLQISSDCAYCRQRIEHTIQPIKK